MVWLSVDEMMRLIEAHPEPFRTLSALLHGAGLEISAALQVRKRDIDAARHAIRAPGTKKFNRDRVARVRRFAWPYLEALARGLLPAATFFEGITYDQARRSLVAAREAAGVGEYTLHDARHTFAVQLLQEGVPHALISANLGHKDESEVVSATAVTRSTSTSGPDGKGESRERLPMNALTEPEASRENGRRDATNRAISELYKGLCWSNGEI